MGETRWTTFGPDPALADLPKDFRACLEGPPSAKCDELIGSAAEGRGFCANPAYQQTTYCACVNNKVACPQTTMAACMNSSHAYRLASWYEKTGPDKTGPTPTEICASSPVCLNILEVTGANDIVDGVKQTCSFSQTFAGYLKTNPTLVVIAFILIISLIVVLTVRPEDDAPKKLQIRVKP